MPRRLIYNYDAWGVFLWVNGVEDIKKNVDLFAGSQVTTIMLCPNMGQSTVYPSKVSEMCHWRAQTPEAREKFHHELGTLFAQASERIAGLWREQGIDCFGLLVQAVVDSGREAFATIRMNDLHCLTAEERRGPYTDAFTATIRSFGCRRAAGSTTLCLKCARIDWRASRRCCGTIRSADWSWILCEARRFFHRIFHPRTTPRDSIRIRFRATWPRAVRRS